MTSDPTIPKDNNFGALRLLFASVVILSHSPEILDGNRHRELLTIIFGTITFGSLGVDGFFIVSGYLITKSFERSDTLFSYFKKRVLRIYPGFIVAFWLCVFVLAPFVGAGLSVFQPHAVVGSVLRVLLLTEPVAPGAFQGMPYPALNGSMWTIAYEFRCYILVAMLGVIGGLKCRFRYILLAAELIILIMNGIGVQLQTHGAAWMIFGSPDQTVHLLGMFGAGMLYYLFRRQVAYDIKFAAGAAVILSISMFFAPFAEFSLAICGSYLVFWFAFRCKVLPISRLTNKTDLSYGIYLYAWPIQSTIAYLDRSINPWVLSGISLLLSAFAAYVSWTFVEKSPLAFAHRVNPSLRIQVESN